MAAAAHSGDDALASQASGSLGNAVSRSSNADGIGGAGGGTPGGGGGSGGFGDMGAGSDARSGSRIFGLSPGSTNWDASFHRRQHSQQ